jgi:hypothetical protein
MKATTLLTSAAAGLALLVGTPAWAVDCEQIVGMLGAGVPANIVAQTMESSGANYKPEEIQCLAENGAPEEVLATARKLKAAETPDIPQAPPPGEEDDDEDQLPTNAFEAADNDLDDIGTDLSDLPEEGDDGTADPRQVQELIQLFRAKKCLTASKGIYDLLEKDEFPEQKSKLYYYMAKSLDCLEMYHGAQHYYMQVVRRGPKDPYFKYALPKLVAIAEYTGNDTELLRIVHKIPPDAFPRQARNHLFYLMGRREYERDNLARSAKYFQQISSKSNLFLRSKYYEGVINHERSKFKSAVKAFRDVYASDAQPADAREAEEYAALRDLSLINIARIYYELDKKDEANFYYKQVDRNSDFWPQSLFERAWSEFMLDDMNKTLGLLLTLKSPYYQDLYYNPESEILRALTFYWICEYEQANRLLLRFEAKYKPMREELKAFLAEYGTEEGRKLADAAFDAYFVKDHEDSQLSGQLLYDALQNRDLNSIVDHLDLMDDEVALIDEQKSVWRDSIGAHLKKVIEKDRQRYKRKAGLALLRELERQNDKLADWLSQSQIIRFEIVDAERKVLEKKAAAPIVDAQEEAALTDFAVSREIIYWPFNGEFWDDELGYYEYAEDSCK